MRVIRFGAAMGVLALCVGCAMGLVPTSEGRKWYLMVGNKVKTDVLEASSFSDIPAIVSIGALSK